MLNLTHEIKEEFRAHALRDSPREACGLVAVVNGKQQYHPCKNIAENAADFILDPADYVRVEDFVTEHAGEIMVVVHSHPATPARPTMADKVGCEVSGLQWVIYSPKTGEWHSFTPSGYRAPLIGRQFKHGIFDCYSALRDWYAEKLSITVQDFPRAEKWWEKGQDLFLENFEKAGFKQVLDGTIEVGDIILVNMESKVVNHCAVYIGNDQVFHQTINRLSSREIYGGLLKKNTRMILRFQR